MTVNRHEASNQNLTTKNNWFRSRNEQKKNWGILNQLKNMKINIYPRDLVLISSY
jgi:hypothetical protein